MQNLVQACDDGNFFDFLNKQKKKLSSLPEGTILFPLNQIQLFILQSKMATGHGPNMEQFQEWIMSSKEAYISQF